MNCFVKNGKKIVGAGVNYKKQLDVLKTPAPEKPIVFLKPTTSYITEGHSIQIPPGFTVNEEIELGVIISKICKNVPVEKAMEYVAGYCAALDLTATSELKGARAKGLPWCIGKGFDTATPVGVFIPPDMVKNPHNLHLWCTINGEMKQEGNTNDMIFSVPELISFISQYMTLEPNDLILTGTPPGMSEVKRGDIIQAGIKDLATINFKVE